MLSSALAFDESSVKAYIHRRLSRDERFRNLVAVSVTRYASEFSAVIWVAGEPTPPMRARVSEMETDLRALGFSVSILLKSDRELPLGGRTPIVTDRGTYTYRYYRLDPVTDEDFVYAFTLRGEGRLYRFRMSLTGTLASQLRSRGLGEDDVLRVYVDQMRRRIADETLSQDKLHEVMFGSRDLPLFTESRG
jgi:hypothetical protein